MGCFNSNMVRLKAKHTPFPEMRDLSFNSNMVRLKDLLKDKKFSPYLFQFQYGTIKRQCVVIQFRAVLSFNSNMVRLKAICAISLQDSNLCFNSNMVRLKGNNASLILKGYVWFQFQYGTIKSICAISLQDSNLCFNSNMVRLKVAFIQKYLFRFKFQFQYGTIKRTNYTEKSKFETCFNSNMVRLKEGIGRYAVIATRVSIPIWYD